MAFPATFKTVQDAVITKTFLDDITANRNLVKDAINQVYAEACTRTQALQEAGTAALVANQPTYTLDARIIELKKIIARSAASGSSFGPELTRASIAEILYWRYGSSGVVSTTGTVTAYALIG